MRKLGREDRGWQVDLNCLRLQIIKKLDQRSCQGLDKNIFRKPKYVVRIYLYTEAPGNRERVRGMRLCYFIEETRELIRVSLETNRENMHQDKHKNVQFLTFYDAKQMS